MDRFTRIRLLVGEEAFARLSGSHIAVIGLGAVGGYAVEGLARAGVGQLTVADFDVVQPANINRQIFALTSTLGQLKAEVARKRVLDINPSCQVKALDFFVDEQLIDKIITLTPDIIVDAVDSLNPKVQILRSSYRSGIPTFSSMGAALRTDPTSVAVADISKTKNCPLARRIRKRLKGYGIYSGITCVYSTEPVDFQYQEPSQTDKDSGAQAERGRTRRTLGSLPTLTGIFGLTLANEVITYILGKKS